MAIIVVGGPSQATLPATPEQTLCNSTYIIVADVLTATSADCRKKLGNDVDCQPKHLVRLKVQVKEVLGAQPADAKNPPGRPLWVGETIDVTTSASLTSDAAEKYDGHGGLAFKATTGAILSEERLQAAYAGQRFLMSVSMTKFDVEYRDAVWAHVWPIARKAWALETMSGGPFGENCPRPS